MSKKLIAAGLILLNAWTSNAHQQNMEHIGGSDVPRAAQQPNLGVKGWWQPVSAVPMAVVGGVMITSVEDRKVRTVLSKDVISVPTDWVSVSSLQRKLTPGFEQAKQIENFFEASERKGAEKVVVTLGKNKRKDDVIRGSFGKTSESIRQWIEMFNPTQLVQEKDLKPNTYKVELKSLGKLRKTPPAQRYVFGFGGLTLVAAGLGLVVHFIHSNLASETASSQKPKEIQDAGPFYVKYKGVTW